VSERHAQSEARARESDHLSSCAAYGGRLPFVSISRTRLRDVAGFDMPGRIASRIEMAGGSAGWTIPAAPAPSVLSPGFAGGRRNGELRHPSRYQQLHRRYAEAPGTTLSRSNANIVPVRPMPVCASSRINSIPRSTHFCFSPARYPFGNSMMPPLLRSVTGTQTKHIPLKRPKRPVFGLRPSMTLAIRAVIVGRDSETDD
jgi:hypothetical protein